MFPLELSDGVFSLGGGQTHSSVTFVATLAADGTMQECDVQPGRVRCTRVTYDDADAYLAGRAPPPSADVLATLKVRRAAPAPSQLPLPGATCGEGRAKASRHCAAAGVGAHGSACGWAAVLLHAAVAHAWSLPCTRSPVAAAQAPTAALHPAEGQALQRGSSRREQHKRPAWPGLCSRQCIVLSGDPGCFPPVRAVSGR